MRGSLSSTPPAPFGWPQPHRTIRARSAWGLARYVAVALLLPVTAFAQTLPSPTGGELGRQDEFGPPLPRSDERPGPEPSLALPPVVESSEPGAPGLRIRVERFEIRGSSVFDAATLEAVVAPFQGRAIHSEELLAARDAVTRLYVDAGYVTSGAIVPDQPVDAGW